ncbi:MAG TPA: MaoC family dehydratase [Acetobacteraceae bacterium]|nr:MaoC family dehydratase [Acetobacteraceae bacterium]
MSALDTLREKIGTEISLSDWLTVDQDRIDRFAEVTGDYQWIHVDRERAAAGPFGTTIAHGFLTLSLLPILSGQAWLQLPGVLGALNYGLDRLRFLTPVKCGARIRNRVKMLAMEEKGPGRTLITNESTMEIENEAKPALVATTLVMVLSAPG